MKCDKIRRAFEISAISGTDIEQSIKLDSMVSESCRWAMLLDQTYISINSGAEICDINRYVKNRTVDHI